MITFLDYFYLWAKTLEDNPERPADIKINASDIIDHYTHLLGVKQEDLTSFEFERLISLWLKDIIAARDNTDVPDKLLTFNFIAAIKNGSVVLEATI